MHPLEPLSVDEISAVVGLVLDGGRVGERPVVAWVALKEPPKRDVLAWTADGPMTRRAVAVSIDRATGVTYESVVNLSEGAVEQAEAKLGLHAPVLAVEWLEATPAVLGDSRVQEALHGRGITDLDTVIVEPWPAAYFGEEVDHLGRRIGRAILFIREHDGDTPWARPIEGLLVIADRSTGEVVEVRDSGATPVPSDPGRMGADDPGVGPLRGDLTPLVDQPARWPEFHARGQRVRWQRWSMRISIHPIVVWCCTRSPTTIPPPADPADLLSGLAE